MKLLAKILITIICIYVVVGSKIVYDSPVKTKYGYYQTYHLEIWGKKP